MPRSKSSKKWLREHFSDTYVKQAHQKGLRSRAAFKLQEIQDRDQFIQPGMTVIDLGAAPGGWSAHLAKWVGKKGKVLALDILPMDPLPDVEFLQGDFTKETIIEQLLNGIPGKKVDWILSDIAPNLSGIESVDQSRSMALAEQVIDFAEQALKDGGGLLIKVFQGEGIDAFLRDLRKKFKKINIRKPKASRGRSREIYILAKK